jgi:hypothetical protein
MKPTPTTTVLYPPRFHPGSGVIVTTCPVCHVVSHIEAVALTAHNEWAFDASGRLQRWDASGCCRPDPS